MTEINEVVEYGHQAPNGYVYMWHKDMGPFIDREVWWNGQLCVPVSRLVTTIRSDWKSTPT